MQIDLSIEIYGGANTMDLTVETDGTNGSEDSTSLSTSFLDQIRELLQSLGAWITKHCAKVVVAIHQIGSPSGGLKMAHHLPEFSPGQTHKRNEHEGLGTVYSDDPDDPFEPLGSHKQSNQMPQGPATLMNTTTSSQEGNLTPLSTPRLSPIKKLFSKLGGFLRGLVHNSSTERLSSDTLSNGNQSHFGIGSYEE